MLVIHLQPIKPIQKEIFNNFQFQGIPLSFLSFNEKCNIPQKLKEIEERRSDTSERASIHLSTDKIWRSQGQTPIFGEFLKISQNFQNSKIANYGETIDFLYSTQIGKVVDNQQMNLNTKFQLDWSTVKGDIRMSNFQL